MKANRIFAALLFVLLTCSNEVRAQALASYGTTVYTFLTFTNATGNGTAFAIPQASIAYIAWCTSFGTAPASITINLQESNDNSVWATVDSSTSTAGECRSVFSANKFVRGNISAVSGGTTTTLSINIQRVSTSNSNINTNVAAIATKLLLGNGTAAAPSLTFSSDSTTGLYRSSAAKIDIAIAGLDLFRFDGGNFYNLKDTGGIYWGVNADVGLLRDAANTLAQRNGTNAQKFRLYGTYTDATNYERLVIENTVGNAQIYTDKAGTGLARPLDLGANGGIFWRINTNGNISALTDNTNDIGASGATRPRNLFVGTSVDSPTFTNYGITQIYYTAANFTTAANTSLQTITGLTIPLPANTVLKMPFSCKLTYSIATAAVAISFGLQTSALTPTNFQGVGHMETALTTTAYGDAKVTNTTATAIVTGTPSAITTIWNAYIDGFIENPSGATTNINVMVATSNAADLVTVYQDSWCKAF